MAIGTRNGLINQAHEEVLAIVLTVASVGVGMYFALYRLLVTPPEFLFWIAVLILGPAAALLLGYTNRPFIAAIVAGSLPATGAFFGQFLRALTLRGVKSAVAGAVVPGSIVLPVSGMLYIIGVGFRADGTLHDRKRALIARMVAVILLGFVFYWAQDVGLVSTLGDH
jgi:hypothetical protein